MPVICECNSGYWNRRRLNRLTDDSLVRRRLLRRSLSIGRSRTNSSTVGSNIFLTKVVTLNGSLFTILSPGFPERLLLKGNVQNTNISERKRKKTLLASGIGGLQAEGLRGLCKDSASGPVSQEQRRKHSYLGRNLSN